MKKILALLLGTLMIFGMASFAVAEDLPTLDQIVLGENTDLAADITFIYHRTDIAEKLNGYVAAFQAIYPNVNITYDLISDYAEVALIRLNAGGWGTIMGVPQVDADEYENFYLPLGALDTLTPLYNFIDAKQYLGTVYAIPSTGNAQGIVYNKAVFADAGIETLPKTPDEFLAALQAIKDNTDAIPLYTNYAAGWTMGAWDAYMGGGATGDADYFNQKFSHTANPFVMNEEQSGPAAVYYILYEAVARGLIEPDYTTTDWEGCKGMINSGEIGCMVLGSWAFSQMVEAGPNGADIGYMPFPVSVGGVQYANAGADYAFAINKDASADEKLAALYYLKWLTHESGFAYSEGGIPIDVNGEYPALYDAFADAVFVVDSPALPGEELLLTSLNDETELNFNAGGNTKIQKIIENAATGAMSFEDIMAEWNALWTAAQEKLDVAILY